MGADYSFELNSIEILNNSFLGGVENYEFFKVLKFKKE
jgi:hypothetical protein